MGEPIDTWAIIELMGHRVLAGHIEEDEVAGAGMLRVDVPAVEGAQGFTKWFSPSAIYGITPTDEETARAAARKFRARPLDLFQLPSHTRQLELAPSDEDPDDDGWSDDPDLLEYDQEQP